MTIKRVILGFPRNIPATGRVIASGEPKAVLTPALLSEAYGVQARVEQCSRGLPFLVVYESTRIRSALR